MNLKPMCKDSKRYCAEGMGTMMLVLIGCGTAAVTAFSTVATALAFGFTFIVLYYCLSEISGCHLNPAVSLAMLISKRINVKDFILYTISQIIGATSAALLLWLIFGSRAFLGANTIQTALTRNTSAASYIVALIAEIILSFIFVFVYMDAKNKNRKEGLNGIIIGLALSAVYMLGINLTGGAVNPARSLGTAIVQMGTSIRQVWIFILAPLFGAAVVALLQSNSTMELNASDQA